MLGIRERHSEALIEQLREPLLVFPPLSSLSLPFLSLYYSICLLPKVGPPPSFFTQTLLFSSWGSTVGLASLSEDCKRSPAVSHEASFRGRGKYEGDVVIQFSAFFSLPVFCSMLV